jgi:surface antigen
MAWGDDTYPGSVAPESGGSDSIGYAWSQCASFCNQQIVDQLGKPAVFWGNGGSWGDRAAAAGVAVDGDPRVGDVICLPPGVGGTGPFGHVACVIGVPGGDIVQVADYNWVATATYGRHNLGVAGAQFIHVGPPPAPAPGPLPPVTWVAFDGSVQVDDAHVRGGPGDAYQLLRDIYNGNAESFDGWCYADAVWDPVAALWDHRWFHIDGAHGYGWVASALINGSPPNSSP